MVRISKISYETCTYSSIKRPRCIKWGWIDVDSSVTPAVSNKSSPHPSDPWVYHFSQNPTVSFESEYGVALEGDGNAYKKVAFIWTIEADEYFLENSSGDSGHLGDTFRREDWHKRMRLNSHLVCDLIWLLQQALTIDEGGCRGIFVPNSLDTQGPGHASCMP